MGALVTFVIIFAAGWIDGDPSRTWPIIAATIILSGEEVPSEWILPQPTITEENLEQYIQADMPPRHYALCGCENMPGYPERWGGE